MKWIFNVMAFIQSFLASISNQPAIVDNVIQFLLFCCSILGGLWSIVCFIDHKIVTHSQKPQYEAKRMLKEYQSHIAAALKNESVFFCEDDPRKLLFYKDVPIKRYHSSRTASFAKLKRSSYLLLGDAGSGKSSVIKKDYLSQCSRWKRFWGIRTGLVYINQQFLNHGIQNMNSLKEIVDCAQCTKYKNIILYIDGIDEFGESGFDEIFEQLFPLSKQIRKVKITSRTNFAEQNIINHKNSRIFAFKETQRYKMSNWQEIQLLKLTSFLLTRMGIKRAARRDLVQKIKLERKNWRNYIDSPLLMKLYLYILRYGDQNKKIGINNKYLFYTQFITEVVATQRKRQGIYNISQLQAELNAITVDVFRSFCSNRKDISHTQKIAALLKPAANGSSLFVHETFFEYFVARYYLLQISKKHLDASSVAVLHHSYTNDFADFITFALNSTDKVRRKQIVEGLFTIYSSTLSTSVSAAYTAQFPSSCHHLHSSSTIRNSVQQLSPRDFFTLKYEIIFRLGRIEDVCRDEIVDFLSFVYSLDENIGVSEDRNYFSAVLKRCCAISSSFLGSEEIELDYIRKMLPLNHLGVNAAYCPNYDLANRSHTLLFYGDITRATIFDFKDNATNNPYSRAFKKRIKRLELDLPEDISLMDRKQKKKYYFRVFDLATIYTFMFNRKKALSDEEHKIISNTRIYFIGASDARNQIMNDLLTLILELHDNLLAP